MALCGLHPARCWSVGTHLRPIHSIDRDVAASANVVVFIRAESLFIPFAFYSGVAMFNHSHAVRGLPVPQIAIEPMQLTSFALSLLLVFRTNASYARWQEARKMFGSITTTGRDIFRQVVPVLTGINYQHLHTY